MNNIGEILRISELENRFGSEIKKPLYELSRDDTDDYLLEQSKFTDKLFGYNFDEIKDKLLPEKHLKLCSPDSLMKVRVDGKEYLLIIEFKNCTIENETIETYTQQLKNELKKAKIKNKIGDTFFLLDMLSKELHINNFQQINNNVVFILVYNQIKNQSSTVNSYRSFSDCLNNHLPPERQIVYFGLFKYKMTGVFLNFLTLNEKKFCKYLKSELKLEF